MRVFPEGRHDSRSLEVVAAWVERAVDGTAASQHLNGTLARLHAIESVKIVAVVADRTSPDGTESLLRKVRRIVSLVIRTACQARPRRVLFARFHPLIVPALLVWRLVGGRIVLSVQGSLDDFANEYPRLGRSSLLRAISVRGAWCAHVLVAGAPVILEHIKRDMARKSTPVIPLANGVFVDALAEAGRQTSPMDGKYVVFVGNLASWQGVDVMAAATESSEWPTGVPLVVVGDGVERGRLAEKPNVISLGRLPATEAARWYAHAYCAISMKRGTGAVGGHGYWPFKLIESAAVGTPIVCSDARGMREAAERLGNAIVVPDGDSEACAAAVQRLVADHDERDRLAAAGLTAVREFDWTAAAPQMEEVLRMARGR